MSNLKRLGVGIGALGIAVGLTIGAYAFAQNTDEPRRPFMQRRGDPGGVGGPMGMLGPRIAERLNLSSAQKDQLKSIADSHHEELEQLIERARTARQAVQGAVMADELNEGLIRARAAELATIESDLAVARARLHAELFQISTPDQQAQAKDARARMQQRRSERRERGSRGSTPPR